jgi:hypothetical protein
MRKILFFSAIFNLILGCQSSPSLQLTSYIRFIAPEKTIKAELSVSELKNPNTTLKIGDAFFNGGAMEKHENKIQGIQYVAERNADFPKDGFFYKFKVGKEEYKATLNDVAIRNLLVVDSLANKKSGMLIRWQGAPLEKNETLTILISDADDTTAEAKIQGATPNSEVKIPGAMFSGLKSGNGNVFVVKRRSEVSTQGNLNINSAIEFYSETVKIKLVE